MAEPLQPGFLSDADDILICLPGQPGHGYIEGNTAPISPETIERLICDSGTINITFDQLDRPLDVGHEQRLFNRAQRRALAARDGGCRWPGCDRPPAFTEAHHIQHWQRDNGRTDINQGILLCRAHHLLLHNQRWQVFEDDGRYWLRPPATIDPGQALIEMPSRTRPRPTSARTH
ncbi:HNH endonuclease signature motif containing protein [Cryobacterium sp. SO1]|uniref:HNH endonuclease signature motif containing protein n=1 Tax=Cryobacterium sp. SO1 TaxID=1897061 RepID=UPI00210C423E|nr:HNH endonuclease signature motif containing protein [Cryobacterium sp. SO1]